MGFRNQISLAAQRRKRMKAQKEYEKAKQHPPTLGERRAKMAADALARRIALQNRNLTPVVFCGASSTKKNADERYSNFELYESNPYDQVFEHEEAYQYPPTLQERRAKMAADALARRQALEKRKGVFCGASSTKRNADERYSTAACRGGHCV